AEVDSGLSACQCQCLIEARELYRAEWALRLVVAVFGGNRASPADRDNRAWFVFDRFRTGTQRHQRALRRQVYGEFLAGLTNCHWHLLVSPRTHPNHPQEHDPRVLRGLHSTTLAGNPTPGQAGIFPLRRTCSAASVTQ